MFCYARCPDGFKADQEYKCQACTGDDCGKGLFYDITPAIIRNELYLYLIFREDPVYLVSEPIIKLNPHFNFQIEQLQTQRRRILAATQVSPIRNITIQLFPEESFS